MHCMRASDTDLWTDRNIPKDLHEIEASVKAIPGIEIKLCVRTYRLFYVTNSEDIFWRKRTEEAMTTTKCLQARNRTRQRWIVASLERKP
jgi:paired amphipathic helix protein Sin3a